MPKLFSEHEPWAGETARPQAFGSVALDFDDLGDPYLRQFITGGSETSSGATVNSWTALRNTSVWRCTSLISGSIGMLPLDLVETASKKPALAHPLYRVLRRRPNGWQSAFDFRALMQMWALTKGNGYARIVRGVGLKAGQVQALIPLLPDRVTPQQNADWSVSYRYSPPSGGDQIIQSADMLHLRYLTMDGLNGISMVHMAREAIGISSAAERATGRIYKHGSFVDTPLSTDKSLSDVAYNRLKKDWQDRYGGADNAGKTPILEEGLKPIPLSLTARDAQFIETRKLQIEEIGRIFGVPRPLLMVDETSWGSGVEALGRFFVQYALNHWFKAWEEAIDRTCLSEAEQDTYSTRFNPRALLRGSMNDQANFFSKALGAGGQQPWMVPNEVRDEFDIPAHPDGGELFNPMTETGPAKPEEGGDDDPAKAPDGPAGQPGQARFRIVGE